MALRPRERGDRQSDFFDWRHHYFTRRPKAKIFGRRPIAWYTAPLKSLLARDWNGFSLKREVKNFEHGLIERALRDTGGSVTRAAHLLGFKHHQSLISLLGGRHKGLETARTTIRKRRRRIVSKREKEIGTGAQHSRAGQISVLHVEDNEKVARTVADFLQQEGMHVDSCTNGRTALKILKGNSHYDAIILDNGLPILNGLELTKRARKIAHRRSTPIVMFSADDVEREAWRVGVDEFLPKPEALNKITSTITRLVKNRDVNNE